MADVSKQCSICKKEKMLSEFHHLRRGEYGRHSHCKICRAEYRKGVENKKPDSGVIRCNKCSRLKTIDQFYKDKSSGLGTQRYCKECHKEKIWESRVKLEGYIRQVVTRLRALYKDNVNVSIEIDHNDIIKIFNQQSGRCAMTGEMLTYYIGPPLTDNKYESRFNIAVDRVDTNGHYTQDNCRLVGKSILKMKCSLGNNVTDTELCHMCGMIFTKMSKSLILAEPDSHASIVVPSIDMGAIN